MGDSRKVCGGSREVWRGCRRFLAENIELSLVFEGFGCEGPLGVDGAAAGLGKDPLAARRPGAVQEADRGEDAWRGGVDISSLTDSSRRSDDA